MIAELSYHNTVCRQIVPERLYKFVHFHILYDKCDASCTYVQYSVLVIKVYDIPSVSLYVALALYVHASSACYDTEVRVYTNTTF
jgi:hypothetical protein